MKQFTSVLLLLLTITPCLMAQKTKVKSVRQELSQARSYVKSGNYDAAEGLMTKLLKDSANRQDIRIYLTWYDAVRGKYNQGNEKLYLKQKYDTTAFFSNVQKMFQILETLDSLDMRPDKRGRVNPAYRMRHAAQLNIVRPNLFNGGTFLLRKNKWKEAYSYFETYLDCARQPLFTDFAYDSIDGRMPEAAYWATYCGYKMSEASLTLRYHDLALRDSSRAQFTLQYIAEAYRWLNDEESYLTTLREGFRRYPEFPYFFPRLSDAYTSKGQYELALAVADSALAVNDSNVLFLFAKSSTLLRMERYSECIEWTTRLLAINDSLSEPYFNIGTAYLNMASAMDMRKDKQLMNAAYQNARFYFERYRAMMPEEKQKWAPALYRIYLNLNMGKQFDEIDRLLKK